ncbi:glutamate-cysteine ligase family protein [Dactylosporangium cerinum]|uniref:Glutamate--cysteine ligase EgtA n=1 Tax=Dactylosporangium cerinum TaxID=1434730 RepID=A0ABV9WK84_9ACTN
MATLRIDRTAVDPDAVISGIEQAEGYIASICFKTGPPETVGVELEYTVHASVDPTTYIDPDRMCQALGDHAPPTLRTGSANLPLRRGSAVTLEPGGQVELSTVPQRSLTDLHDAVGADLAELTERLGRVGLELGGTGIDPHRSPRRMLSTPRYDAMASAFARRNGAGRTMMCSTAGLQVCLDAGPPSRWAALHDLGPPLIALFANSRQHAGHDTGWASARMRTWLAMDPSRTRQVPLGDDPALEWARYALDAQLLCVRRDDGPWTAPAGVTFADWIDGVLADPPTYADLDYHLSTLFPPVRPRGYLEVRYLDTLRGPDWFAPAAVLTALVADEPTIDRVRELCAPVAGQWALAARLGMADPALAKAATAVRDLALDRLDLPAALLQDVIEGSTRNGY